MSAASVAAADVVVDTINAAVDDGDFAQQFTAVRAYVPRFVLEDSAPAGLQVFVCPTSHGNVNFTRDSNTISCGIVVSVIQKLVEVSNEEIDPLIELVEQLKTLLSGVLSVLGQRALCDLQPDPLYRPDQIIEGRVFWSMFTVTVSFPQ